MPEPNSEEHAPELTEQQKYVNEKVAVLLDQIGDEYGESLTPVSYTHLRAHET